jgi:Domain of unknown function (DUF4266)
MKATRHLFWLLGVMWAMAACTAVKPYQRAYLNDDAMQLGKRTIDTFDDNIHLYREGSAGGGGKASGGCGCN